MEQLKELRTDYERAEYLQNILIALATGREADDQHYQSLRTYLLHNPLTRDLLPSCVRTNRNLSQFWVFIKYKFPTYAERRSFIWSEFSSLLDHLEVKGTSPAQDSIKKGLQKLDSDSIHQEWAKALERKTPDPEGAITIARTLLESICKYILDELGIEYEPSRIELHELYKKTSNALNLAPSQYTEEVFKQILGGCSAIVSGLGTLRNKLGDAHGKGKSLVKPASHHAELAINLSGAMALFLAETFIDHKKNEI
jgi:hypothetical protein